MPAKKSEIQSININLLDWDIKNPRLPENLAKNPKEIVRYIATTTAIEDLMQAIASNGFFGGEPLIAIESKGRFIVLEGNRRLTAVKLLNDPYILDKPSQKIIDLASSANEAPRELPVVVKKTREEVLPYLGFRHITGVKQWEPLAKARYIESLFNMTNSSIAVSHRYAKVASNIGSRKDHIKRNLDALAVYREISNSDFYGIEKLDEESLHFAVLSTAAADERLGKFLGVIREDAGRIIQTDPIVNPDSLKREHVKELTRWLFEKDKEGTTRVGESRNIKYLSMIVDTPKALEAFRDGATLAYAYRITKGANEELRAMLYEVESVVARAASIVAHVDYDEDCFTLIQQIRDNVTLIGRTLKGKKESEDGF